MNIKRSKLFNATIILCCLGLTGCLSIKDKAQASYPTTSRWLNPLLFGEEKKVGASLYDLTFEIMFATPEGDELTLTDCSYVFALGETAIAAREFTRWQWLKSDCSAANWYFRAPETAISYWDKPLNLELLKTFPATTVPELGGQGFDGLKGVLGAQKSPLTLIEEGEHNVKVDYDGMVINYVLLAKGDFNRDGNQDLFLMLDWYIKEAHGKGFDWVVVTKTAPDQAPMMLWRR